MDIRGVFNTQTNLYDEAFDEIFLSPFIEVFKP